MRVARSCSTLRKLCCPPSAAAVTYALRPLHGKDQLPLRAGAVLGRRKMAKHFALSSTDTSFAFTRNTAAIAREAALDGGGTRTPWRAHITDPTNRLIF